MPTLSAYLTPILLLLASNVFMTFAWYGHLKYKASPIWIVIFASWGIAFFEYCLQVPANRMGHAVYSAPAQGLWTIGARGERAGTGDAGAHG